MAQPTFRPVRRAFDQVADQLRELIVGGQLAPGARLPTEGQLARSLGVSRPTVREALRTLTAQNLVRTSKGANGGTFVATPSLEHISDFLRSSLTLLADAEAVSLEHLIEARELIEVPAARLAAARRSDQDVERLRDAIPGEVASLTAGEQFVQNRDFHTIILEGCGNVLLSVAAQPVFSILQTRLSRSTLDDRFHRTINQHHGRISQAIAAGNGDFAEEEMRNHLSFLRPAYERAWRRQPQRPRAVDEGP